MDSRYWIATTNNEESANLIMRKNLIYLFSTVMALSVAIPGTAAPSKQIAEKERGPISLAQPSARLAQPAPDMRMDFIPLSDIMEQQSSQFVKQLQLAKSGLFILKMRIWE